MFPGIYSKDSPFFLLFGSDPLATPGKILSPKARYLWDEKGLLRVEATRYALALARKNICINRKKSESLQNHKIARYSDKSKTGDLTYAKRHSSSTWKSKWECGFFVVKFLSHHIVLHWKAINTEYSENLIYQIYVLQMLWTKC